ncbi:MAG: hypothetical protein IKF80_06520 [Erysipelotrichaceae bacterium]|nr:hypothetical protein [Erysipelotrichaceae bacterium]
MENFERKLSGLFDYQRFERNRDLQRIINNVEQRYDTGAVLLTEAELSFAAGGKNLDKKETEEEKVLKNVDKTLNR